MKKKLHLNTVLLCLFVLFTNTSWAAKPTLGEIASGSYQLISVTNHTPELFKKDKDYWNSLQKIQLEMGNEKEFKDLPKLASKTPFTGVITLGDRPQKFGVIIDIAGEEKRLYIDTNGDRSFTDEPWIPLLNEWLGIENYWVICPEPIMVLVNYQFKASKSFPLEISVEGFLLRPGTFSKEKPYLLVKVRTWFLAKVVEDGAEKYMAISDRNNNGCFNDPLDQLLIDYNNNGFFSKDEVLVRQKGIKLKNGKRNLAIDWDVYPDNLLIGGKISE